MSDDQATREAQTRDFFTARAQGFDASGVFARFGQRLVEVVGVEPGQSVLDVACGRGAVLFPAAERAGAGGHVEGVDLAEGMVQATNAEAERRGVPARVRVMDAQRLEFPGAAFDRVFCGFGLGLFPDPERALGEFRRVLRPGGRLGVSTWRVAPFEEVQAVLDELALGGERPVRIAEPDALAHRLERAGFIDVRVVAESWTHHYADAEEYWQSARRGGPRRLAALDAPQLERTRATLLEQLHPRERPDGLDLVATALLGIASR